MNTITINYENIMHNFALLKEKVCKNNEEIFPVLKADGYGLNSIKIAEKLLKSDTFAEKSFFVFSIDEAIELKQYFNDKIKNIYVLDGLFKDNENLYCKYNITPIFNTFYELYAFINYIKTNDINPEFCLQFNTGMNRNGFDMDRIKILKNIINKYNLNLKIIITHFACGNDKNHCVSIQQIKNCEILKNEFKNIKTSFYATDASLNFEDKHQTNILRIGAGLHGFGLQTPFKQTFNLKSIAKIKDNNVIINIGLNNGLFQEYEKYGYVYINGEKIFIRQIKNDFCILNISDNYEKYINQDVLLTGYHNNDFIHIDDFAKMNCTIAHEIQYRIIHNIQLKKENFEVFDENNNSIIFDKSYNYKNNTINIYNNKLYSKITGIRTIKKTDNYVGYDALYKAHKGETLITIAGGYVDYIYRGCMNKYVKLKIKNRIIIARIVGKISMDQIVVSLGNKLSNNFDFSKKIKIININKNNKYITNCCIKFLVKNNKRITSL